MASYNGGVRAYYESDSEESIDVDAMMDAKNGTGSYRAAAVTASKVSSSTSREVEVVAAAEEVPAEEETSEEAASSMELEEKKGEEEAIHKPSCFTDEKGNLKFVNTVVRRPCTIFTVILFLCFGITFLLLRFVFANGNPFTNPENEFDLSDVRSIQYDSLRLAQAEVAAERNAQTTTQLKVQSETKDLTYWVYETQTDEGVFGSSESIAAMKEAFDIFLDDEGFENYCLLKYSRNESSTEEPKCDIPLTPLSMYYPSQYDSDLVASVIEELKVPENVELFNALSLCFARGLYCELVPDEISQDDIAYVIALSENMTEITKYWDLEGDQVQNFTQVTELASYMLEVDIYRGLVDFGFDKGFSIENPVSVFSRGILFWGGPLADRGNLTEEEKEEADEDDADERKEYVKDTYLDDMDEQAKEGTHSTLNSYYFMVALIFDVILVILQQDAMLALFSLTFVFIWIRVNTGSWFLAGVGLFEILFSIPVAWFIFSVVFRIKYFATLNALSIFIVAAIGADDIFIFMDAYKQSKFRNPENLCDLETRMSWVYRRTGTAMAITSATTCAAFLCTLITPLTSIQSFGIFAAVVILIDYVLVMTLYCTAVVIYHDRFENRGRCGCCCTDCSKGDPTQTALDDLQSGEADEEKGGDAVSTFFRTTFASFIKTPMNRIIVLVVAVAWIGTATWQLSKIEATKEAEQFLSEDHPLQKSITILNNEFPTADEDLGLKVYFAYGLGEVDRNGVNLLLDPENYGQPVYLSDFEFNEQCQTELMNWCDKLRTDSKYEDLIKRNTGVGQVYCFMEELAAYAIQGNLNDCDYVTTGAWKSEDWQLAPDAIGPLMDGFLRETSCYDDSETIGARYVNEMGWDGTSMRYAALAVEDNVLVPFSQLSESVARKQYDQHVLLAKEIDESVSQVCTGPVVMTDLDEKFVFMNNQAIYVQTAIQSSVLGVAIAFAVLLISTRVLHIAFFASLSIISVLISVTGTMVILGWTLGSIESILIGIIAGFSVDYVVHLAHAYKTANGDTYERVTEAFADMGISVLNGMITSVGASIPLFFCQLQFFAKFGTFLCLTIAFSWLFANFAFMSVLAMFKIPIKNKGCGL